MLDSNKEPNTFGVHASIDFIEKMSSFALGETIELINSLTKSAASQNEEISFCGRPNGLHHSLHFTATFIQIVRCACDVIFQYVNMFFSIPPGQIARPGLHVETKLYMRRTMCLSIDPAALPVKEESEKNTKKNRNEYMRTIVVRRRERERPIGTFARQERSRR